MYTYKFVHYLPPLILIPFFFAGMALNKHFQTFLSESFNLVHNMELRVGIL